MKRYISLFVSLTIACSLMAQTVVQVWVAPTGSDAAAGTEDAPFATLGKALEHVRELRKDNAAGELGEVQIVMRGGTYRIGNTIELSASDGGTPESPTIIIN